MTGPTPSRSVLSTTAEAEPLKPGKVWDEHSILLLEGREPLPDQLVTEIEEAVRKVTPAGITCPDKRGNQRSAALLRHAGSCGLGFGKLCHCCLRSLPESGRPQLWVEM